MIKLGKIERVYELAGGEVRVDCDHGTIYIKADSVDTFSYNAGSWKIHDIHPDSKYALCDALDNAGL